MFFLLKIHSSYFMSMNVLPVCVYVHSLYEWYLWQSEEGIDPWKWCYACLEPSCGCWQWKMEPPLQEQHELSLQSQWLVAYREVTFREVPLLSLWNSVIFIFVCFFIFTSWGPWEAREHVFYLILWKHWHCSINTITFGNSTGKVNRVVLQDLSCSSQTYPHSSLIVLGVSLLRTN